MRRYLKKDKWHFDEGISIGGQWWCYKLEGTVMGLKSAGTKGAERNTKQPKRGQRIRLYQI